MSLQLPHVILIHDFIHTHTLIFRFIIINTFSPVIFTIELSCQIANSILFLALLCAFSCVSLCFLFVSLLFLQAFIADVFSYHYSAFNLRLFCRCLICPLACLFSPLHPPCVRVLPFCACLPCLPVCLCVMCALFYACFPLHLS